MTKILPKEITSYDLLKAAAVLLMIVDHIGYYFYPEDLWFRAVGRLCVPIWFFFVGYARSRDLSPRLWIGATILLLANMIAGLSIFPLNVIFTILFVRLLLDATMKGAAKNAEILMIVSTILLFLALPTYMVTEYGTQGLIMAMFGYIMRNNIEVPGFKSANALASGFCLFTVLNFIVLQQLVFAFDRAQMLFMFTGVLAVCGVLYFFKPVDFPKLTKWAPGPVRAGIQVLGRRTLEIYVAHLILFKFIGMLTQPERFKFLQWTWVWGGG